VVKALLVTIMAIFSFCRTNCSFPSLLYLPSSPTISCTQLSSSAMFPQIPPFLGSVLKKHFPLLWTWFMALSNTAEGEFQPSSKDAVPKHDLFCRSLHSLTEPPYSIYWSDVSPHYGQIVCVTEILRRVFGRRGWLRDLRENAKPHSPAIFQPLFKGRY